MTRRLLFVTLFLLAVWTTLTIWQITVRENLASAYALQTRQDAPQRQDGAGKVDSTLFTLAQDLDALSAEVDRLVGSQGENIDRLRTVSRGEGEMLFIATAYTHVATPGVADINGTGDGITATGVPVHEGLIATDPSIIPTGSLVYIISDFPGITGYYVAGDTGSMVKGLRVDIFREDRAEAMRFGKRRVRVRIVAAEGVK